MMLSRQSVNSIRNKLKRQTIRRQELVCAHRTIMRTDKRHTIDTRRNQYGRYGRWGGRVAGEVLEVQSNADQARYRTRVDHLCLDWALGRTCNDACVSVCAEILAHLMYHRMLESVSVDELRAAAGDNLLAAWTAWMTAPGSVYAQRVQGAPVESERPL